MAGGLGAIDFNTTGCVERRLLVLLVALLLC